LFIQDFGACLRRPIARRREQLALGDTDHTIVR
jgi:hypothetical protein